MYVPINLQPWVEDSACRDLDDVESDRLFFNAGTVPREARELCARCPVQVDCLEYGQAEEFGVFGGLSAPERIAARAA